MRTIDHSYISSDLSETTLLRSNRRILDNLLSDRTTNKNIRWGTDNYSYLGSDYSEDREIKVDLITGWHDGLIQPRADKANDVQLARTRNRAEVFTPSWIVEKQVNAVMDELWNLPLEKFLSTRWLEITCGEAPYMVNRYDMISGQIIPLKVRAGFIDVKFRRLNTEIADQEQWLKLAIIIYQSSYGYEYQGDSLLLARENLLLTFMDNFFYMFGSVPSEEILYQITEIISMNVFQMDGLTYQVPYSDDGRESVQLSLFEEIEEGTKEPMMATIFLWKQEQVVNFIDLVGGSLEMKFDVVIGNPPYQDEKSGMNEGYAPPIYHYFIDASHQMGKKSILIHPARFLFNGGSTPKSWNKKILSSNHIKIKKYFENSKDIFDNTDIKGGVAISYYDENSFFRKLGPYTPYEEIATIMEKVSISSSTRDISEIIYTQNRFNLMNLYSEFPNLKQIIGSNGKDSRFRNNIFSKVPQFTEIPSNKNDIKVIGLISNKRVWRYLPERFVDLNHENITDYKVLVPRANGTGRLGETLSSPFVAKPLEGYTQTFIGFGSFKTIEEAENLLKYIKTKFLRTMLSVLKITQDNDRGAWKKVPLQDFTSNSDIDWSKSVAEIDQQLYAKYGLNEEEINFIETNVKEMV